MTNKTITISWTPATQRTDNASLPSNQIDSVHVYTDQGAGGAFFSQGSVPAASGNNIVISNVPPGTYKYKLATVDTNGQEGSQSGVITAVVPALPALPNPPSGGQAVLS